jgi:hypothetical protein
VVKFNLNRSTGEFYSREVHRALLRHPAFKARFTLDYAFMTKGE